jgi:spore germination protein GerM
MMEGSLKDKILTALLLVFVVFLIGAFIYFLLWPKAFHSTAVKIYFFRNDKLVAVTRTLPEIEAGESADKSAVARFAAEKLLAGPTAGEIKEGFFTQIPQRTKILRLFVENGTVFVDFNRRIGEYGGGTTSIQGIISQVVYTLTDVQGIKRVSILVEGKSKAVLGGEGYTVDRPLRREDVSF